MASVLLLLLPISVLIMHASSLECDWAPKPNSPLNTLPVDKSAGDTGRFVRSTKVVVPPHPLHDIPGRTLPHETETAQLDLYTVGSGEDVTSVVHLYASTPYGRGFVHGTALKQNVTRLIKDTYAHFRALAESGSLDVTNDTAALLKHLGFEGALQYVANVTAPHTSDAMAWELRGLADGAGVAHSIVVGVHLFPELMQSSCTTVSAWGTATVHGEMLAVRALDWDTSGVLQNYPALFVYHPMDVHNLATDLRTLHLDQDEPPPSLEHRNSSRASRGNGGSGVGSRGGGAGPAAEQAFASLSWLGFVGMLTGHNAGGLSLATIGVGYPDSTFGTDNRAGTPWLYVSRDVVEFDRTPEDAVARLARTHRTSKLLFNLASSTPPANATGVKFTSDGIAAYSAATLQPDKVWHVRLADTVWWSMDWNCPTFDSVHGAFLTAHHGPPITHYKSKWRNIWIRDVFCVPAPLVPGPNGPNQNTSRIQIL